jgi:TonB family protein
VILSPLFLMLANAISPPPLEPLGKWSVEYGNTSCTASRAFGDVRSPVVLALQPSENMIVYNLVLLERGDDKQVRQGLGSLALLPGGSENPTSWISAPVNPGVDRATKFHLPESFLSEVPQMSAVRLKRDGRPSIQLATGSLEAPLRALKKCGTDLLRSWGVDPGALIQPASTVVPAFFQVDDYPIDAIRAHQQGVVVFALKINAAGRPQNCTIITSSGASPLDKTTCSVLMTRGRFQAEPNGPSDRYLVSHVNWMLPN